MKKLIPFILIFFLFRVSVSQNSWQSKFLSLSGNNHLEYKADIEGNVIPDFSRVGYGSGETGIPDVTTVEVVEPVKGDNRKNIQNAIDKVGTREFAKNVQFRRFRQVS